MLACCGVGSSRCGEDPPEKRTDRLHLRHFCLARRVVEVQGHALGVVQLANVRLHSLSVTAFLLRTQVTTPWRALLFVTCWAALPLLYLALYRPQAIAPREACT